MKILLVEDDVFVQTDLKEVLESLGHEVLAEVESYEEVLDALNSGILPDVSFVDIQLTSSFDGVDVAELLRKRTTSRIVFLTSNTDDRIIHKANQLNIDGYLVKPFKADDIKVTISMMQPKILPVNQKDIFIRIGYEQIRIHLNDILFATADDNYVELYLTNGKKLLSMSLKNLEEQINFHPFLRVHRSHLINTDRIDKIGSNYVVIQGIEIPVNEIAKIKLNTLFGL